MRVHSWFNGTVTAGLGLGSFNLSRDFPYPWEQTKFIFRLRISALRCHTLRDPMFSEDHNAGMPE